MESDLRRVSGLWLKDGKRGKFMSGQTDADIPAGAKLLIFKNDKKDTDRQPDYHLYFAAEDGEQRGDRPHDRHSSNGKPRGQQSAPATQAATPPDADSIPF